VSLIPGKRRTRVFASSHGPTSNLLVSTAGKGGEKRPSFRGGRREETWQCSWGCGCGISRPAWKKRGRGNFPFEKGKGGGVAAGLSVWLGVIQREGKGEKKKKKLRYCLARGKGKRKRSFGHPPAEPARRPLAFSPREEKEKEGVLALCKKKRGESRRTYGFRRAVAEREGEGERGPFLCSLGEKGGSFLHPGRYFDG